MRNTRIRSLDECKTMEDYYAYTRQTGVSMKDAPDHLVSKYEAAYKRCLAETTRLAKLNKEKNKR